MRKGCGVLLLLVLVLGGCGTMNLQLWGISSSGGLATVLLLDAQSTANLPSTKARVRGIAKELLDFLGSGTVADLTKGALKTEIYKLVPYKYRDFADAALARVSMNQVYVGRIGQENVDRIKAFLTGVLEGCDDYLDKYHPAKE